MKIKVLEKKEMSSGFGKDNRAWHKWQYIAEDGTVYYMFDDLEVGKEYEIESKKSTGKDGKEYTNWGLSKKGGNSDVLARLERIEKAVNWLVRNNPNYQPTRTKPESNPPY